VCSSPAPFLSILLYSPLFHSILFSSILLYSPLNLCTSISVPNILLSLSLSILSPTNSLYRLALSSSLTIPPSITILSYPILSYPILSYPILFYPILSYPTPLRVLSHPIPSHHITSHHITSHHISFLSLPFLPSFLCNFTRTQVLRCETLSIRSEGRREREFK
jgi:hypothetical protein